MNDSSNNQYKIKCFILVGVRHHTEKTLPLINKYAENSLSMLYVNSCFAD